MRLADGSWARPMPRRGRKSIAIAVIETHLCVGFDQTRDEAVIRAARKRSQLPPLVQMALRNQPEEASTRPRVDSDAKCNPLDCLASLAKQFRCPFKFPTLGGL